MEQQQEKTRLTGPERKARRTTYLAKARAKAEGTEGLPVMEKLARRDIREMVKGLSKTEVRDLVDFYYQIQDNRKGTGSQIDSALDQEVPCEMLAWVHTSITNVEDTIRRALDEYTELQPISQWAKSIVGIGPVISAGLQANIDLDKAHTAGHIWRFAGLTPDIKWEKGQKRPFNLRFKVLCWKIGDSFMKHRQGDDFYGRVYEKRKQLEWTNNVQGKYADQAEASLTYLKQNQPSWPWAAGCYSGAQVRTLLEQGIEPAKLAEKMERMKTRAGTAMLPPGRINLRAQRVAVKLFLSHWHEIAYELEKGRKPERPYAFVWLKPVHEHYLAPPNWPMEEKKGRKRA
jgi:hypothetical protein